MKNIKWKTLFLTSFVCLLPILFGLSVWEKLPDTLPIHFNIHGEADNYASRAFAVIGLPFIMALFQVFCCITSDWQTARYGGNKNIERVTKWSIPCLTTVLYVITIAYGLGHAFDIRKPIMLIIGILFILIGNYMPKLRYVNCGRITGEKARKINRFVGFATVILGICFLLSVFLPPHFSVGALLLCVPYTALVIWCGRKVEREDEG